MKFVVNTGNDLKVSISTEPLGLFSLKKYEMDTQDSGVNIVTINFDIYYEVYNFSVMYIFMMSL